MHTNNFSNVFNKKPIFIIPNVEAVDYIGIYVNGNRVCKNKIENKRVTFLRLRLSKISS